MIVLDIETSGLDLGKAGIWQIGAVELENPENYFIEEARIDDTDQIEEGAMKVIGKTEEELRDPSKQSQKQMIIRFLEWTKKCKDRMIIGQNIGFDLLMMQTKSIRYGIHKEYIKIIGFKGLDTYTLAQMKYLKKEGKFSLKEDGRGDMGLHKVLEFCGMEDNRIALDKDGNVEKEGKNHNALEDAKLTAECFSRLVYGKTLFPEYEKFKIPEYLNKEAQEK